MLHLQTRITPWTCVIGERISVSCARRIRTCVHLLRSCKPLQITSKICLVWVDTVFIFAHSGAAVAGGGAEHHHRHLPVRRHPRLQRLLLSADPPQQPTHAGERRWRLRDVTAASLQYVMLLRTIKSSRSKITD